MAQLSMTAPLARPGVSSVSFFVVGRLENPLNGSLAHAHWSRKSAWAAEWKIRTAASWACARLEMPREVPKRITFTCYVGASWDDDNLPAACKPIRDALIGRAIQGDAKRDGHEFLYEQHVDRQRRGVDVHIEPRTGGAGENE